MNHPGDIEDCLMLSIDSVLFVSVFLATEIRKPQGMWKEQPSRTPWICLSQELERSDLRAYRCVHHLAPTFFLYMPGFPYKESFSQNLPNSLHVPLLHLSSTNEMQFHSLSSPPSAPVPYLPLFYSKLPAQFSSNIQELLVGTCICRPDSKPWPPPHRVWGRQSAGE